MNYQPNLFLHRTTQCACCDQVLPLTSAVVKAFHISEHIEEQEHFCSQLCLQNWYIDHLRRAGL